MGYTEEVRRDLLAWAQTEPEQDHPVLEIDKKVRTPRQILEALWRREDWMERLVEFLAGKRQERAERERFEMGVADRWE